MSSPDSQARSHAPIAILGLNAWHGDSSACLMLDGKVLCAVEEERFRRVKHWAGLPTQAIQHCLDEAGLTLEQLDAIAVNRDPKANRMEKVGYALSHRIPFSVVADRLKNRGRVQGLAGELSEAFGIPVDRLRPKIHHVEHHRAHLASAFFVSPFDSAAVASVDGFGDFSSARWGHGRGRELTSLGRVGFPHSLGLYYLAVTQYLGFPKYGDEYKVMGLAAYGEPVYLDQLRDLVKLESSGGFRLNLKYYLHHKGQVPMTWEGGEPSVGKAFSPELEKLLGPARQKDEPLEQKHKDLAASAQALYEECLFHLCTQLAHSTGEKQLCLAGGCGMNSLANGKITANTPFEEVYVAASAGDAGGAVGAAAAVWCDDFGRQRTWVMDHAYLGPKYDDGAVQDALASRSNDIARSECEMSEPLPEDELLERVVDHLVSGHVVGWFQGRMEWGPRALGNRSILGDPRRTDMQDILNLKIKRRESFRPFAPSILEERTEEWFERPAPVPFMGQVLPIQADKRDQIPAVTHADGTGRLQTVSESTNPRYHRLIQRFEARTGVPIVLNTSFNENEPVVCRPEEALDCFLRTKMDLLVLGDRIVERIPAENVDGFDAPLPQEIQQASEEAA
jgi:carbamoyltransferase